MLDENTNDSPEADTAELEAGSAGAASSVTAAAEASGDSGLPQEPIAAAQPVTSALLENAPPAASKPAAQAAPPAPPNSGNHRDLRLEPRIRVKWYADALIDGQYVYQGFVKDISLNGTDIFLGHNLQKIRSIKLRIYVPPLSKKSDPYVIVVAANVRYTAYDSKESLFHTGVNFTKFNLESDQTYLQSRIAILNQAR